MGRWGRDLSCVHMKCGWQKREKLCAHFSGAARRPAQEPFHDSNQRISLEDECETDRRSRAWAEIGLCAIKSVCSSFSMFSTALKKILWCVFSCLLVLQWIWEVTSFRKLCDKKTVTQGMTDHLSCSFLSTPCWKRVWVPDLCRKHACVPGRDFCGKEQGSAVVHPGHPPQLTSLCVRDTKIEYAECWRRSNLQVRKFFRF